MGGAVLSWELKGRWRSASQHNHLSEVSSEPVLTFSEQLQCLQAAERCAKWCAFGQSMFSSFYSSCSEGLSQVLAVHEPSFREQERLLVVYVRPSQSGELLTSFVEEKKGPA